MLGMPGTVDVRAPDGATRKMPMWTYWLVQEGTL
jgi:hypothetical protein